jgi:hypothetical protein
MLSSTVPVFVTCCGDNGRRTGGIDHRSQETHPPPEAGAARLLDDLNSQLSRIPGAELLKDLCAPLRLGFGPRRLGQGIADIVPSSQATSLNPRMK